MPQENVEIVRQMWKVYGERGTDGSLDFYAPDCVCEAVPEGPDAGHVYPGWDGVREREALLLESVDDLVLEPLEFVDAGEAFVVGMVSVRARGKGSGIPIEGQLAFAYELRDGRIVHDRVFTSKSEALEAAGLSE
jgi:ketosteroid isomerase-like protein